jgi:hypothetical protein
MSHSNLLEGYILEAELAREPNMPRRRTLARYRSEPNGLPYVRFAGKIWIPISEGREWLVEISEPGEDRKRGGQCGGRQIKNG